MHLMVSKQLGGHRTINGYVRDKLRQMPDSGLTFDRLFGLMFSEQDNVMLESSSGYRITEVTYGECRLSTLKKAACLRERFRDLPEDAVIGLYMENSRDWIETFWAILLSGFCPLLMNLRLDHARLEQTLEAMRAKAVIASGEAAFSVQTVDVSELSRDVPPIENVRAGSVILLMSSGTSDHVKTCAYTADAFRAMIEDSYQIVLRCPQIKRHHRGRLKLLTFLPLYHVFGLVAVYIWFAFFARTFVLLGSMSPKTIVNTIRRHGVTHIFAVPLLWNTVYDQAMRTIRQRGKDTVRRFEAGARLASRVSGVPGLRRLVPMLLFREVRQNLFGESIRFLISGGSEIRPEVLSFFNTIGYRIANGYGMTEIGITSVELSADPRVLNSGSVGRPFSSAEYRVGEDGILWVRSRAMACRIHDGSGWTQTAGEWFRTGDLAECRCGRYYILGRSDDLVIAPNGENLNPNLIESGLRVRGVKALCLIGVQEEQGMKPVLLVNPDFPLPGEGLAGVKNALTEALRAGGTDRQIQSVVFVREPLMREDEIKLNRARIARRYRDGEYTVLSPERGAWEGGEELHGQVRALVAQATGKPAEEIGDDADFFLDLGGTSLDYFGLISQLQEAYGVPFPVAEGETLTTVRALSEYLVRTVNADE